MIDRRSLIAAGAGLVAAPALLGRAEAQAPQLRISTAANENDWLARAMVRFKEIVDRELPGQLNISVHPNSSLFRQGTELPALQRGNLECFTMTTFEVEQQIAEYGAFSAGYTFRDWGHATRTFAGPIGAEYVRTVAQRMEIEITNIIYLGTRQLNLRQAREVNTPADLNGVRLRIPPGAGWVALARGLGATPTPMAFPEVYLALKNGAIDAQENPLPITRVTNMHEVTQQIVMSSHMVQPVFMAFNKPFHDRLNDRQKEVIRAAARQAADFNDQGRLADEQTLQQFFAGAGLRVTTPNLEAFRLSMARIYVETGISPRWAPGLAERIAQVS